MTTDSQPASAYLIETHGTKTTWTLIGKATLDTSGTNYSVALHDGYSAFRLMICPDTQALDGQIDLFPVTTFVLADTLSVSIEEEAPLSGATSEQLNAIAL